MSVKKGIIVFTAIVLTLLYYFFDPSDFNFGPPCLLHASTGWLCWGCGGQRAFHQLLHGNFQNAFQLNALIFPVVLLFGYIVLSELRWQRPSYQWLRRKDIRISTAVIVMGFTVFRNLIF